jgi:hypothetical protein
MEYLWNNTETGKQKNLCHFVAQKSRKTGLGVKLCFPGLDGGD